MGIEINLSAEDIDQLVRDSIMKAGFGKAVEDGVRQVLNGYNSTVQDALRRYIGQIAAELLETKFSDQVKGLVHKYIEQTVTQEVLDKVTSTAVTKLVDAANRGY